MQDTIYQLLLVLRSNKPTSRDYEYLHNLLPTYIGVPVRYKSLEDTIEIDKIASVTKKITLNLHSTSAAHRILVPRTGARIPD